MTKIENIEHYGINYLNIPWSFEKDLQIKWLKNIKEKVISYDNAFIACMHGVRSISACKLLESEDFPATFYHIAGGIVCI